MGNNESKLGDVFSLFLLTPVYSWLLIQQSQKPNESMMIISNGRLELSVPKRDIMPPNFNAPHILVAIRECPIIGTVWVDKQGDEFL